jgi:hypothetical protein
MNIGLIVTAYEHLLNFKLILDISSTLYLYGIFA